MPGTVCYAVALGFGGAYLDAISCSLPIERLREGREHEILNALRATKHTLESMAPAGTHHNYPGVVISERTHLRHQFGPSLEPRSVTYVDNDQI